MPISPARSAAFDILLRVDQQNAFASELLHSHSYEKLSVNDHRLTTELVMGVLRCQSRLDEEIAGNSALKISKIDPEVLISLRLASYQLMFLDRIPARAAVHESVELIKRARKRSAVPFANAVLRKMVGSGERYVKSEDISAPSDLARRYAHPQWLVDRWIREFGFEIAREICTYDQQIPDTTIAIREAAPVRKFERFGVKIAPGRFLTSAYSVVAGDLRKLPTELRDKVAIQDEGSQLVAMLLGTGSRILDCCAAPGGKTRVLAERNPTSLVIATELHTHRARLLRNLVGTRKVQVIAADARKLPFTTSFDAMLVDVPCAGTGTLARNPEIKWRLKPEDISDLQNRQTAILKSAMQHLASGGQLVYSTCSLEREENEDVVEKVLAEISSFRLLDCRDRLQQLQTSGEFTWENLASLTRGPYLRTIPGVHHCDGFFAAILEKI
jgi:16S rRNA (cytosine967-C5)-methyltransferase